MKRQSTQVFAIVNLDKLQVLILDTLVTSLIPTRASPNGHPRRINSSAHAYHPVRLPASQTPLWPHNALFSAQAANLLVANSRFLRKWKVVPLL
jgi:hypothetical protein